jgi:hypothetical protein
MAVKASLLRARESSQKEAAKTSKIAKESDDFVTNLG